MSYQWCVFVALKLTLFKSLLSGFEVVAWWLAARILSVHRKREGGREGGRERMDRERRRTDGERKEEEERW